eukprot:7594604-Pyramimonas_sp.AAC.1
MGHLARRHRTWPGTNDLPENGILGAVEDVEVLEITSKVSKDRFLAGDWGPRTSSRSERQGPRTFGSKRAVYAADQ